MSRSLDRRTFLKGLTVLAAAAPAAALFQDGALAADRPAASESAPAPTPACGPDFSICHTAEERALLERQYASALETVQVIRKTPLPAGVDPAAAFAAVPRVASATVPPPTPAPGTPRRVEDK